MTIVPHPRAAMSTRPPRKGLRHVSEIPDRTLENLKRPTQQEQ